MESCRDQNFFTGTTITVNFCMAFLLLIVAEWVMQNNFGVLQWLPSCRFGLSL